jgi:cysteine desulfurase / selenocysteine lyase
MLNLTAIREQFPILKTKMSGEPLIYFDNAATTLKPSVVIDDVTRILSNQSVNIHRGDYQLSYDISNQYEDVRKTVAKFINASENEIVFTSGATQSLNDIAYGLEYLLSEGDVVLTSHTDHASNLLPWFEVTKRKNAKIEYFKLTQEGRIDLDALDSLLHDKVKFITLVHVSNVLGYINPVKEIIRLAHQRGICVILDGAQSVAHLSIDVKDLDVDFLAWSGHKMCSPTGVGVLYGKKEWLDQLKSIKLGGGANAVFNEHREVVLKSSPARFEAGTPAIESTIALKSAISFLASVGMDNIHQHELVLKNHFISKIQDFNHIRVYNPNTDTGIVIFNVDGIFAQDAAAYLSSKGIAVRAGNHCAKLIHHVIGVTETLRASFYLYNTIEEVDKLVEVLRDITLEKCVDLYI